MSQTFTPDDVHAIPVGKLFSLDADRYSIPLYQRNYTWGEEQIHRLVYDVLDEAEHHDAKDYFLGNLVVAPPAHSDDPFDVIDGQQRLTTLYILLLKLRTISEVHGQIGALQPLTYEAREKATRALRGVVDGAFEAEDGKKDSEDSGILRAAKVIDQLLDDQEVAKRFLTQSVIDYLLHRVLIIRMPIERTTDLNRYFEIMNTRGAQLSPMDIVKARLMRHLTDPGDRELLNRVWSACSDMEHYVAMTATAGDTTLRKSVFGEAWEKPPTADFAELRVQLIDSHTRADEPTDDAGSPSASTAKTFDDALAEYSRRDVAKETDGADGDDRFTSQVNFPTLLLHVLAVRGPEEGTQQDDRQLDDKLLVRRFSDRLEELPLTERAQWVRGFTTDLLRIRFLFDQYILKRDATLTTGHESTSDEEPGSWSLYRLSRGDSRSRGPVRDTPRYPSTFASDESGAGPGSLQRRILLLQSALRITYTSPRTMHWITDVLRYVTQCADQDKVVTAQGLLDRLESHALERLDAAMNPDSANADVGPDGHPLGFGIPRIVFTYLDYLLVQQRERWDFTFSYRTSIEHFSPATEDVEHASPAYHLRDRKLLNWLGNLALVTVSANSKFSNYQPAQKAHNHAARRQSLKLELMARRAETGSWNDEDIKAHHEEMVGLLREALANWSSRRYEPPMIP